jgi:ParB family chromosome partitioning protein
MARKPILGTPLGSLLSSTIIEEAPIEANEATQTVITTNGGQKNRQVISYLPVERLQRSSYQPRREFDEDALNELAASIRAQGIVQPIVTRRMKDGKNYEIIAGERRWRAAQLAGLTEVPTIVREVSDETALAMTMIENLQREDLNPLEEASGLEQLMSQFQLTHQELADVVGKSRSAVTNFLRLLSLRTEVKTMLEHNDLEVGHARALLALEDEAQVEAARTVVARSLSVRQTEALVRSMQSRKAGEAKTDDKAADPDVLALQDRLSETLGAKVLIQCNKKGKGKVVVEYSSLDELEGILSHIS